MTQYETLSLIVSFITVLSVFFAGYQILDSKKQARTNFEDSLNHQFRELLKELPTDALLCRKYRNCEISDEEMNAYYRYFDLCNEQCFLRQQNRVCKKTWNQWNDGIRTMLVRPAFQEAWNELRKSNDQDFSELRRAEREKFKSDPRSWNQSRVRGCFVKLTILIRRMVKPKLVRGAKAIGPKSR